MNLTDAYTKALLLANDFKALHWHAAGSMFDFIHNKSQEFYEMAQENADWLAEEAIKEGQKAFNPSDVKSYIDSEYTPVSVEVVDIQTFIYVSSTIGNDYIDSLRGLFQSEPLESWQLSKIDEMCEYWDKEINYKLEMMKLESSDTEIPTEDDSSIADSSLDSDIDEESEEDFTDEEPTDNESEEDSDFTEDETDNPTKFDNIEPTSEEDETYPEEKEKHDFDESIDMIENPLDRLLDSKSKFSTKQRYVW